MPFMFAGVHTLSVHMLRTKCKWNFLLVQIFYYLEQYFPLLDYFQVWCCPMGWKLFHIKEATVVRKRFEVLTSVVIKSSVFWDITLCSPLKFEWCFGHNRFLWNVSWLLTDYAALYHRRQKSSSAYKLEIIREKFWGFQGSDCSGCGCLGCDAPSVFSPEDYNLSISNSSPLLFGTLFSQALQ
jgi:hypothetical protein